MKHGKQVATEPAVTTDDAPVDSVLAICPHCGEDEARFTYDGLHRVDSVEVCCMCCGARTAEVRRASARDAEEEAANLWNRRAGKDGTTDPHAGLWLWEIRSGVNFPKVDRFIAPTAENALTMWRATGPYHMDITGMSCKPLPAQVSGIKKEIRSA
ncbi:MAG: hypothetical protein EHM84_02075 [Lysobacterales bacterium]|nr:MAG: hypothetical protein EHM84_02075 [Xanthomonadales bacterium]